MTESAREPRKGKKENREEKKNFCFSVFKTGSYHERESSMSRDSGAGQELRPLICLAEAKCLRRKEWISNQKGSSLWNQWSAFHRSIIPDP